MAADCDGDIFSGEVIVRDGFLSAVQVRKLVNCAQQRFARGDFCAARVGSGSRLRRRDDIRGDSTCWLAEPLFAEERALLAGLEQLRLDLNRQAFLGLFDLELHYAHYPPGTGYERHVDQPQGRDQRVVSMVLYLNESWTSGDGGELRVFDSNDNGSENADGDGAVGGYRDIEPTAGRLVCFLTAAREHAVLATRTERWSVSGWFRRRDDT